MPRPKRVRRNVNMQTVNQPEGYKRWCKFCKSHKPPKGGTILGSGFCCVECRPTCDPKMKEGDKDA